MIKQFCEVDFLILAQNQRTKTGRSSEQKSILYISNEDLLETTSSRYLITLYYI